jgi:hypothetical protein
MTAAVCQLTIAVSRSTVFHTICLLQRTTVHFVRTSDTLQSIALSYGLSVEDFCKLNDLKPGANSLAGKTLVKVPDTSGPSKPAIEGARLNLYVLAHNLATVLSRIDAGARTVRDCRFAESEEQSAA